MFFGSVAVQDPFRSKIFVRPFPWMWRIASASAFLVLLVLTFVVFQKPEDVQRSIHYMFPSLELRQYPETYHDEVFVDRGPFLNFLSSIWSLIKDKEILEKFLNWFLKAFIFRDWTFLWYVLSDDYSFLFIYLSQDT